MEKEQIRERHARSLSAQRYDPKTSSCDAGEAADPLLIWSQLLYRSSYPFINPALDNKPAWTSRFGSASWSFFQIERLQPRPTLCPGTDGTGYIGWEQTSPKRKQRQLLNRSVTKPLLSERSSSQMHVNVLLSLFLQPQSTDFTQYSSYGDMCGGGRGESFDPNLAAKPISCQLHQS